MRVARFAPWGLVLALCLAALSAVLLDPTRYFVGAAYVDGYGTTWYYWFMEEVLAGRQPLGHSDRLFYPWGKDLYLHTGGNLLDAALVQPLRWALGPTLAYNTWIFVVLLTNAWGVSRLAGALGVPRDQRWPAMVLLTLSPYVLQELDQGRPTQAMLVFPALTLAALIRLSGWRDAVIAGVCMALAGLTYWYNAVVLALLAVPLGLFQLIAPLRPADPAGSSPWIVRSQRLGRLVLAGGLALGLALPGAWPMLEALEANEVPGLLAMDGDGPLAPLAFRTEQGDPEGLFVLALSGYGGSLNDEPMLGFRPGLPLLLPGQLVILGLVMWCRRPRGLAWLLGGLWIACGPALVLGEHIVPNTPYLWLMQSTDVLRRWWWPARAVFVPTLMVAAMGAVVWSARPAGWGRRLGLLGVSVALIVPLHRHGLFPMGRWDGEGAPVLGCLSRAPAGGVIDLPLVGTQENLYYQTLHHQPLLGGMLMKKEAFGPAELQTLKRDNTVLGFVLAAGERNFGRRDTWDEAHRAELLALGYRYVLVQISAFDRVIQERGREVRDSDWSRVRRMLSPVLGEPTAEDPRFALYTLDGSRIVCEEPEP